LEFNIAVTTSADANQNARGIFNSCEAVRLTTSNFRDGQTDFTQKVKKKSARQKTLRRDADFGFIFRCRFKLQPPRAAE